MRKNNLLISLIICISFMQGCSTFMIPVPLSIEESMAHIEPQEGIYSYGFREVYNAILSISKDLKFSVQKIGKNKIFVQELSGFYANSYLFELVGVDPNTTKVLLRDQVFDKNIEIYMMEKAEPETWDKNARESLENMKRLKCISAEEMLDKYLTEELGQKR